jgi:cytochrome P450
MVNPRLCDAFGTDDATALDLTDPQTFADRDLGEFWRDARANHPVYWHLPCGGQPGFWVVSRHADVQAVYRDNQRFTSERGNVLVTLLAGGDSAAGQMLAVTDGRRHRELRNIMARTLTPRTLRHVSQRVRENTRRQLRDAVERGECDFATDVANNIPLATICDLLGVPERDRDFLLTLTKSALSSDERGPDDADSLLARNEILLYFGDLVAQRRVRPGADVISALAASRLDGEPLTEDVIVLNCYSLIIGGDETSRLSMIDAVLTLAQHPDQWRLLKQRRVGLESATEEVLRWATPTMHFGRTALAEVEMGGEHMHPGDRVTVWHSSANRDERAFPQPDVFNLARSPNRHVTFGYGPHFCLGAFLARMEISEMLDALRAFVAAVECTGPTRRIYSNFLTGMSSLPVRLVPDVAALTQTER